AELGVPTSRLLRQHLSDPAQAPGIPRVIIERASIIRVLHVGEVDGAWFPDEVEQIIERVALGRMRKFVSETLNGKCVINVCYRTQPANANVRLSGTILDAKIRQVIRHVGPALLHM